MSDKSYRIHTSIAKDTLLNVDMGQDFNFLEVLTLRLSQSDAYKLHSSSYGVVMGRILANDAFGIPNAKVSIFIEKDGGDVGSEIEALYPYVDTSSRDKDGRRYNLLPDYSDDKCYRVVGTFPNKRLMLDDNVMIEVFDKYYKYTTVTNASGDYMLFGVPSGSQMVHVDLDLSDIGILSQKPRDFEYKGYNVTMFDNPNQFKESTSLEGLAQIFSQDRGVFVYPFWGDEDNGVAAITRCDINIQYKFEPTCVFMGSIVSDNDSNSIGHKCAPSVHNGMNDQLIAGEGTIEMIRKTPDGLVEEFQIQGNQLINSDGVWCYQIPMNLDYIGMDECGNIVPTDNPSKGIPTRTQVRFRISKNESGDEGFSRHTAKYLVPMNPMFDKNLEIPTISVNGSEIEKMYQFGSSTPQNCFRDLYWNNVYSVKNYIPKVQVAHRAYSSNYGGLKGANLATDQNPIPFNKLRIDIPFNYMIICILFTIVMKIIGVVNAIIRALCSIIRVKIGFVRPFAWIGCPECISLNAGMDDGNVAYYPGCGCPKSEACKQTSCPDEMGNSCKKKSDDIELEDKIQQNLALEYNIVKLDLYQDWVNGVLYMPLWYWRKRKKRTFLFGLFSSRAKNEFCDCDKTYSRLKTYVTCNLEYGDNSLKVKNVKEKEEKWHKDRAGRIKYTHGLIKGVTNKDGLTVYYYTAIQPTNDNPNPDMQMSDRKKGFKAIRLYATDIILLGNLNENNLYGIPQFFKALPSTTSNVPAIAAIEESISELNEKSSTNEIGGDREESGDVVTAGMDWGARGGRDKPMYKKGLFMDLSCTYAVTKAKACVNVERLSEYGVNLDMAYFKSYSNGANNIERGLIGADGFITKLELDDEVNRAMFATMNHVGFVPQTYQDNYGTWYDTQVEDSATRYLIPKFKYIYPVDFDGRAQDLMTAYKNNFEQAMLDIKDESYLTFRLGAEASRDVMGVRHFYLRETYRSMPLYNNSFYFYFGVNKGKTAIEKFNELFDAQCFKNNTSPFTLEIESRGKSFCSSNYLDAANSYAYIRVTVDDIQTPFSYTLLDENQNVVISEIEMMTTDFAIGGIVVEGEDDSTYVSGVPAVFYHDNDIPNNVVDNKYKNGLTNQVYTLDVVDSNFKMVKTSINISAKQLEMKYAANKLGTKFFDSVNTPISEIHDDKLYGKIIISGFSVDGYEFDITTSVTVSSVTTVSSKTITTTVVGVPHDSSTTSQLFPTTGVAVYFTITLLEESLKFGDVTTISATSDPIITNSTRPLYIEEIPSNPNDEPIGHTRYRLVLEVDRPSRWSVNMMQKCCNNDDCKPIRENGITETIAVPNGEAFVTMLNGMPNQFLIGDGNQGHFYSPTAISGSCVDDRINGWFGVHQEETYLFADPKYIPVNRNQEMWSEFVNVSYDMNTPSTKQSILKFKFDALFGLSSGVYVTEGTNSSLTYTAKGGVPPTRYVSLAPYYDGESSTTKNYLFSDINAVTVDTNYPNIVGSNYQNSGINRGGMPQFNPAYGSNSGLVGNYFVSITDDGSGVTIPRNASSGLNKSVGEDKILTSITQQSDVYGVGYNSYLRGMFVDRRLDYDLWVFTPFQGKTIKLEPSDTSEVPTWNYSRIMGKVYNGIEMSYDNWYNIISATSHVEGDELSDDYGLITAVTPMKRYEYSYEYGNNNSGDVKTVYNDATPRTYWDEETIENGELNVDRQLVKRFYTAKFNGYDIRNYFWSSFNKESLASYANDTTKNVSGTCSGDAPIDDPCRNKIYVMKGHENSDNSLYNGDFNRNDIIMGGYPTVRYLDVINKGGEGYVSLNITSCSYNTPIEADEGKISAMVSDGEDVDLTFDYSSIIQFKPKSADDNEFINLRMTYDSTKGVFTKETMSLIFSYLPRIEDGFDIYSSVPTLIKVLPKTNGMDGITYMKMASDENDVGLRRENVTIVDFKKAARLGPLKQSGIIMPSSIRLSNEGFLSQPTTHNDYENVTFVRTPIGDLQTIPVGNVDVMSIEYENKYICNDGSKLKKSLHTVEFSDMYDLRDIKMNIVPEDCWYINPDGEKVKTGGVQEEGWTHELAFIIDVGSDATKNSIFDNAETLGFSFRFRRRSGPYYVPATDVIYKYETVGEEEILESIKIIVDWTSEMDLGNDNKWRRNALFITTRENFTYGLQFGLAFDGLSNPAPTMNAGESM